MHPTHLLHHQPSRGSRVAIGIAAAAALVVLLVGPPWMLVRFGGWPLPAHLPTVSEIVAAVSQPPGTALVLGALLCLCWLAWAAFTLDVAVAVATTILDTVRGPRHDNGSGGAATQPALRPVRGAGWRPGAALVGIVLVALLAGTRPASPATSSAMPVPATLVHPATPGQTPHGDGAEPGSEWVTVRGPAHGVHDSLWRISERELHDPTRWPEIYQLNAGQPQTDGRTFHDPDLIQPQWQLRLPTTPTRNNTPADNTPADNRAAGGPATSSSSAPPPTSPPPGPPPDVSSPHNLAGVPDDGAGQESRGGEQLSAPAPSPAPGTAVAEEPRWIEVGPSVALSAAFAALIAATLALRRHSRRRSGSDVPEETFPVLPVVREIAWQARTPEPVPNRPALTEPGAAHAEDRVRSDQDGPVEHVAVGPPTANDLPRISRPRTGPTLAVRGLDGPEPMQSAAWEAVIGAARSGGGIGLAGRGAYPVLRALLLELVFTRSAHYAGSVGPSSEDDLTAPSGAATGWEVVVCEDLPERLGMPPEQLRQLGVTLTDLPPTTARQRHTATDRPVIVLGLAPEPDPRDTSAPHASIPNIDKLDAVLVLAGPWPAGVTAYLGADGIIIAAGPTVHAGLVGQRLPALDVHTTTELLDLQAHTAHDPDTARSHGSYDIDSDDAPPPPTPDNEHGAGHPGEDGAPDAATTGRSGPIQPCASEGNSESPPRSAAAEAAPSAAEHRTPSALPVWTLTILGPVTLRGHHTPPTGIATRGSESPTLSARMRDLLVFLAIHPNGVRRDAIVAALWPDTGRTRPSNNLSSLMRRLNFTLRPSAADPHTSGPGEFSRIVIADGDRYRLDNELVDVDYWTFLAITSASVARSATDDTALDPDALAALHHVHDLYGGPLGEDIDHDWILSIRESARRTYLSTTARLVRHNVDTDPATALHVLESARNLEPLNEALYRDIIALQYRIGDNSGAAATVALLQSILDDMEQQPEPSTAALIEQH